MRHRGRERARSSGLWLCETMCIHGRRRHPLEISIEFVRRLRDARSRAAPSSDSVKLGGRRPRAGARREGVGEPRWFGRPRGSPFHFVSLFVSHTPVTHAELRGPGRGRGMPEHSGGITGAGPGWSGAPWVSRPRSSSPGASITVIPGRWNVPPPCPGHAHLTYERARPLRGRRAALSLYACKLLAPPTHTTVNTLTVGLPTRATQTPCP